MDRLFKNVCVFLSILIVLLSFFTVIAIAGSDSPSKDYNLFSHNEVVSSIKNLELNMTSIVYVQDDKGDWKEYKRLHGDENRIWVPIKEVPQNLINAFIAIEDQRFYSHSGVDWKRTGAAFLNWLPFVNILSGNQGGSTLTQQLIKNITNDNTQNASRKFREIIRALYVEKMLDKETILEAYLNTISLGNGICGVQVAANYYFNKDVSELSLSECASIAAITKNPSANNPVSFPEKNDSRRKVVLDKMLEQDLITYEEYSSAFDETVTLDTTQKSHFEVPVNNYFIDALIDEVIGDLAEKYSCSNKVASTMLYNGGYKIYATVNPDIQSKMEKVYENVPRYFPQKAAGKNVQSAMTITDYSGHIVGLVGGVGKKTVNRGLNRAVNAPRQPGSTMKPIGVYAPALDSGVINYGTVIEDKPLERYYKDGKPGPKEWYGYYAGNMSVSKAIERSANTIPCHILKDLGVEKSYSFLTESLGMKHLTDTDKNLSALALGGCTYGITTTESASAYAVFGNGGKYYEPTTYYKIERANGELVMNSDIEGKQAIKPATAFIMNKLLQNVVYGSQGTGGRIRSYSKMKAYAKTGTSSESYDLWMVAGTPYYVGSVWYGFDQQHNIYNAGAAAEVWRAIMTDVHKGLETKEFPKCDDVITRKYCKFTGNLAGKNCSVTETGYFVPGVSYKTCNGKHGAMPDSYKDTSSEEENTTQNTDSQTQSQTSESQTQSTTSSQTSSVTPYEPPKPEVPEPEETQ